MCDRVLISKPNLHTQVGYAGGLGTILLVTHLQCIHPGCRFGPLIYIPVPRCWCRDVPRRTRPQCRQRLWRTSPLASTPRRGRAGDPSPKFIGAPFGPWRSYTPVPAPQQLPGCRFGPLIYIPVAPCCSCRGSQGAQGVPADQPRQGQDYFPVA